jgi:hypothetical protein
MQTPDMQQISSCICRHISRRGYVVSKACSKALFEKLNRSLLGGRAVRVTLHLAPSGTRTLNLDSTVAKVLRSNMAQEDGGEGGGGRGGEWGGGGGRVAQRGGVDLLAGGGQGSRSEGGAVEMSSPGSWSERSAPPRVNALARYSRILAYFYFSKYTDIC